MNAPQDPIDPTWADILGGTSDIIAGLLAHELLQHVGSPAALPDALLPDVPAGPDRDRALFALGAAVGAGVGFRKGRRTWSTDGLAETRRLLYEAGFDAMAALAGHAAAVPPGPGREW